MDIVDVLGVPLSVSQIQNFLSNDAPVLQNAQLLISNENVSEASNLLQQNFDRDIFDAGVWVWSGSWYFYYGRCLESFSDAYDNLSREIPPVQ